MLVALLLVVVCETKVDTSRLLGYIRCNCSQWTTNRSTMGYKRRPVNERLYMCATWQQIRKDKSAFLRFSCPPPVLKSKNTKKSYLVTRQNDSTKTILPSHKPRILSINVTTAIGRHVPGPLQRSRFGRTPRTIRIAKRKDHNVVHIDEM